MSTNSSTVTDQTAGMFIRAGTGDWTNADLVNDRLKRVIQTIEQRDLVESIRLLEVQKSFFDQMAEDLAQSGPNTDRLIQEGVSFNDLKLASLTIVSWMETLRGASR